MINIYFLIITIITISQIYDVKTQNLDKKFDNALNFIFNTNLTINVPQQNPLQQQNGFQQQTNNQQGIVTDMVIPNQPNSYYTSTAIPPFQNNYSPLGATDQTFSTHNTNNNNNNNVYNQNNINNNDDNIKYEFCGENKVCVPFFICKNGTDSINNDGEYLIDIRFDDSKPCTKYLETCCNINDRTSINITQQQSSTAMSNGNNVPNCGNRNIDGILFRITGDIEGETEYGEFPWMMAILKEEIVGDEILTIYKCGGSLIHPNVVLTAAHCIMNYFPNDLIARAGEWDTQTKDELFPEQDRKISNYVIHEKFGKRNLQNDIALLFTSEPFNLGVDVNTICLPPFNYNFENTKCYATGWGKDVFGKEGKYQVIMKKLNLPIVRQDQCEMKLRETRLGKFFNLHDSFICAGGELGKDTCKGDGGSPLVCPIPNTKLKYHQSGIVAWGIGCGSEVPGVYGNVAYFRNWIDSIFTSRNLDKSYYIATS